MSVRMLKKNKNHQSFGDILRSWREIRKITQMELALDVDVSSRHLSFVETGKSRPSRTLVLKIAHALKLPLRHQNALLKAVGYASEFDEEPLNGQKMNTIRQALSRILETHEPYPALVINSGYNILMKNSGFDRMVTFFSGETALKQLDNVYRYVFAEDGLRRYIKDWPTIEHFLLARLWEEVLSTQNDQLIALYKEISRQKNNQRPIDFHADNNLPVMSLKLEKGPVKVAFFTTITTLGTPLDLTAQELRIESLFPADEETKQLFSLTPPQGNLAKNPINP